MYLFSINVVLANQSAQAVLGDKPSALGASCPPVTIDAIFISTKTIITVVILITGFKNKFLSNMVLGTFGPSPCGKAQHIKKIKLNIYLISSILYCTSVPFHSIHHVVHNGFMKCNICHAS